ncbi:enamine deaminase RidA (YjgF/YER057c/UK114 family) [Paraburkholderia sp. GAS199]
MSVNDIVKVTPHMLKEEDIPAYAKVRARILNAHKPVFMLAVNPALIKPGMLVEVEIVASKAV